MTDLMVFPESLDEFMEANPLPAEKDNVMTEDQIKHLVDRFLQWRLPKDFSPDAGISYQRPNYAPKVDATPSGTNLLDAAQATDMVRFMVEGMPASPAETVSEEMVKTVEKALQKAGKKWIDAQEFPEDFSWADVPDEVFARAALETVALAHADDGWRPIESTPRIPGKPIDLWVVPGTPLFGERGKPYREADARLSGNGKHWLDRQGYYIEGRRYRDCDGEYFNETDRSPDATIVTHYRIPAPPKDGRE